MHFKWLILALLVHLSVSNCLAAIQEQEEYPEDDRVIDLQELLRDVSNALRGFQQDAFQKISDNLSEQHQELKSILMMILDKISTNNSCKDPYSKTTTEEPTSSSSTPSAVDAITVTSSPTDDERFPKDCAAHFKMGHVSNGVYTIHPESFTEPFKVFCEMDRDGGGWTVLQRRQRYTLPKDYFFKNWEDYKNGFGKLETEFWLGNDKISLMSQQEAQDLQVDLWDLSGNYEFAKYSSFTVENEQAMYRILVGGHSGTVRDCLSAFHNGRRFSTPDNDDWAGGSCAVERQGAWWFNFCVYSHLNGLHVTDGTQINHGIVWLNNKGDKYNLLSKTQMKIRPRTF